MRLVLLASALGNIPKHKHVHKVGLFSKKCYLSALILKIMENGVSSVSIDVVY
jgi:hypothetical protein